MCVSQAPTLNMLLYLALHGRLRSLACFLPDGTTRLSRRLAKRTLVLFNLVARLGLPCVVFGPSGAKAWSSPGASAARGLARGCVVSCTFGLSWSRPFEFLAASLDVGSLTGCCPKCKAHSSSPQGGAKCLAESPQFVVLLAERFRLALRAVTSRPESPRSSFENLLSNDLLATRQWHCCKVWKWDRAQHINVHESDALVQLYRDLCVEGGDLRFPAITDSAVCLGAHQKGRTSAKLLCPSLRRASALLGGGLYPDLLPNAS